MDKLKRGDLVITLPKIGKVSAILGDLEEGLIGVIVETEPRFDNQKVYGVAINGRIYYLFEDEIEKLEAEC
tara:strand:+ start:54 stop:266 length:213 start_codon:yes stop_codon:yes gene_type:complete